MDSYQEEILQIKKVLEENPKGMTVTDISRKIKINRNSVAKYLDIMRISGHVEMITFGPAKVFFPSRRVSILNILNFTSDCILIFDEELRIKMVNDAFIEFIKIERERIIGQTVTNTCIGVFRDEAQLLLAVREALKGRDFSEEFNLKEKGSSIYIKVKIVPTTFEDGRQGATLIVKNITDRKLAENAIKESEENFRNILKKMNKK
jgi:PAS domain S-box-containing protein